jgi:hypothetical protein
MLLYPYIVYSGGSVSGDILNLAITEQKKRARLRAFCPETPFWSNSGRQNKPYFEFPIILDGMIGDAGCIGINGGFIVH